jgi:hypothetical protein
MGAVREPACWRGLETPKRQRMRFSSINLPKIETGFIGVSQVSTVGRNDTVHHRSFRGIGGEPTFPGGLHGEESLRGMKADHYSHQQHESDHYGCQPPDLSDCRRDPLRWHRSVPWRHGPITPASHGFHKARIFRRVPQGVAQPPHRRVQAMVEVNKGVGRPKLAPDFLSRGTT